MSETGKKWKLGLTLNEQVDLLEQERARMTGEIVNLEERVEKLEAAHRNRPSNPQTFVDLCRKRLEAEHQQELKEGTPHR